MGAPSTKQKALCVATRCTTAQQFIETFHRFCDEQSFFVATMNMRPVGLETPFSIQLLDKTPVLRGLCVVLAAWTTPANPHKRPGIRLGIRRLTPESEAIFYQLQAMRTATPLEVVNEASEAVETPVPLSIPPIPTAQRVSPPAIPKRPTPTPVIVPKVTPVPIPVVEAKPPAPPPPEPPAPEPPPPRALTVEEQRTPGSDFVLPANPLQNLSDDAIVGFVDCTLYEETGNFFRTMDDSFAQDEPAPPPAGDPPTFRPATATFVDEPTNDPTIAARAVTIDRRPMTMPPPMTQSMIDLPVIGRTATGEMNPLARTATGEMVPFARTATGEMIPLARTTIPPYATATGDMMPLPAPDESSVVASLARVENSVARLLDAVDTSRPIDASPRATPLPAGEAYARQVEKRALKARSKWLIYGGGAAVGVIAIILVVALGTKTKKSAPKPAAASKPVAMSERSVAKPTNKPVTDAPKVDVDAEELAAVNANTTDTPVVGEGPCRVEVKSTPAGTMVSLDGQSIGPSPVTIAGPCTKRRVDLVHPRYKAEMRWVTPLPDKAASVDITLARPTHSLLVVSSPSGATVSIAGRRAGTTPTRIPLMGFSVVEIKVEKKGFDAIVKRVYSKVPNDKLSVSLPKVGTSGTLKL